MSFSVGHFLLFSAEIFCAGGGVGGVRPSEAFFVRPSRFFCPDAYLCNVFSDVILQEFVLAYEDGSHQVSLHCTNWKYVMALFYCQIYIVDR